MYKTFLPAYSNAKITKKNRACFARVMMANVLPRFFGSQCIRREDRKMTEELIATDLDGGHIENTDTRRRVAVFEVGVGQSCSESSS